MASRNVLASTISLNMPWGRPLPMETVTFGQADLQHVALVYRGVLAGAAVVTGTLIGRWFDPIIVRADTGPITARADTKVGL